VISTGQIVAAGAVTAVSVAIAAAAVRWRVQWILPAAFGALVLIIAWRALSNLFGLNGDFLPAVSIGDVGCLLFGAIAPAAIGASRVVPARRRWVPAIVGALVGFVINVFIL
jgi:hypothetical protein